MTAGEVVAAVRGALRARSALRKDCEDAGCKLRLPSSSERKRSGVIDLCLGCGETLAGDTEGERAVDRLTFVALASEPNAQLALIELKSKSFKSSHLEEKFKASERRASEVLEAAECDVPVSVHGVLVYKRLRGAELTYLKRLRVGGHLIKTARCGDDLLGVLR